MSLTGAQVYDFNRAIDWNRSRIPKATQSSIEHKHQKSLIKWADLMARTRWPELKWLHAIPNGGLRGKALASRLKAEGVKAGVPDLFLPVARGLWHGLYIEMKRPKDHGKSRRKPTKAQYEWIEGLRSQNYRVEVCWGWQEAADLIEGYMGTWE